MKRGKITIASFMLLVISFFGLTYTFLSPKRALANQASYSENACKANFKSDLMSMYGLTDTEANRLAYYSIFSYEEDGEKIEKNTAMDRGCFRCATEDRKVPKGVAWINGFPNNTISRANPYADVVAMFETTTDAIAPDENGIISVYFHGVSYTCGTAMYIGSSDSGGYSYDGIALHILDSDCRPNHDLKNSANRCKTTSAAESYLGYESYTEDEVRKVRPFQEDQYGGTGNKPYVKNIKVLAESTLGRTDTSSFPSGFINDDGYLNEYHWSFPGQKIEVKIDVAAFKEYVEQRADISSSDNTWIEGNTYQDSIYVYRCPKGAGANNVTSSTSCGTDESILRITIPPDLFKKTCSEKYPNKTSVNRPSWWSGAPFEYNECGGTSVLASQVKVGNTSSVVTSESGSSEATLYVKPGATVEFDHFYLSASQKATNTEITVNGTTNAARYFVNGNGNWRNGHYVTNSINGGDATGHGWTNNGGSNVGTVDHFNLTNYYDITKGPGGNSHSGANNEHGVLRTGSQVSQRNVGDVTNPRDITINENLDGVTSNHSAVTTVAVSAVVPYNYVNTAEAAIPNNNSRIYVGETARIDGTFRTKGKTNGRVVGGDSAYATVSPNTSYRLYSYYSDRSDGSDKNCLAGAAGCDLQINVANIKTNSDETPDGSANNVYWHASPTKTINIPDISLGTTGKYLCVTAAIYPANSGDDTSLNPNGNDQWDSQTKCAQLAKKPTFQIRGGNLYTAGSIAVNTSTKNNLDNNSVTGTFAFGPWIEHGIIAGKTNEAASGAALGYTGNSNGVLRYDYNFGASASSTCKYQPITVANNNCYSGSSAGNAGNSGVRVAASDTVNLDDYMDTARIKGKHVGNSADGVDLSDSSNYIEVNGVRYTYANSGLSIKATGSLPSGTTHVIFATGAVAIVGNLQYNSTNNGAGYTKASEIPQYIVISNGNINIGYSVTRVDAWLIAKNGTIDTCKEGSTVGDESECAKQLRINGPIVAKDLELDRAYGAATGAYSAVPAEVINVSPATYIFSQAKANESTSLRTVYSKEVAPRW